MDAVKEALLEACQEFVRWFDGWCPTNRCCARSGLPVHHKARAAIAKAEAEKPAEPACTCGTHPYFNLRHHAADCPVRIAFDGQKGGSR